MIEELDLTLLDIYMFIVFVFTWIVLEIHPSKYSHLLKEVRLHMLLDDTRIQSKASSVPE
jgi:hypothetical protein